MQERKSQKKPENTILPRIWEGSTVFILGGGPTLLDVDLTKIQDRRIIGVNNAYGTPIKNDKGETIKYEPRLYVDVCWFVDGRWWEWHYEWLKDFPGIITHSAPARKELKCAYYFARGKASGIMRKPGYIAYNSNAGGSAINLAYHLGASRIILLGFDMRRVDNKANWHDDHPAPDKNPYWRFIRHFPRIAKDAMKFNVEIINCTPLSAITVFPIMSLEEYLSKENTGEIKSIMRESRE